MLHPNTRHPTSKYWKARRLQRSARPDDAQRGREAVRPDSHNRRCAGDGGIWSQTQYKPSCRRRSATLGPSPSSQILLRASYSLVRPPIRRRFLPLHCTSSLSVASSSTASTELLSVCVFVISLCILSPVESALLRFIPTITRSLTHLTHLGAATQPLPLRHSCSLLWQKLPTCMDICMHTVAFT